MENKFLVVTGNEYGVDLLNQVDLNLLGEEKAYEQYDSYLEEFGCAAMLEIQVDKLVIVKSEATF